MAQGATSTCSHVAVAFQMKTGLQTFNLISTFISFVSRLKDSLHFKYGWICSCCIAVD